MMYTSFNHKLYTTTIYYNPTNASDETDVITVCNELSSPVRSIPKHNLRIIRGNMNAQTVEDETNKFYLHKSLNRNGE